MTPSAQANSLGDVILDGLRGEIRDGIGDSVRRDVCRQREENRNSEEQNGDPQNQSDDFCDTWQEVDRLGDAIRRGSNGIRALDAIFN